MTLRRGTRLDWDGTIWGSGWCVPGAGGKRSRPSSAPSRPDSPFAPAYSYVVQLNYALGDTASARRFAAAAIRLNPQSSQSRGFQALHRLLALSDTSAQARVFDSLPGDVLGTALGTITYWLDPTELAVRIARHRLRAAPDTQAMHQARYFLAHALALRGHLREALAVGDTVPGIFADAALLGYVPEEQARATFRCVAPARARPCPRRARAPLVERAGDTVALRRFAQMVDSMARLDLSPGNAIRVAQMATAARAHLALARGDTATALRRFDSLSTATTPCAWWCQNGQLLFARLLAARGRLDQAARVLNEPPMLEGNVLDASPAPLASDVFWYLERARVAERLGDSTRAREAYRYVATPGVVRIPSSRPTPPRRGRG